MNAKNQIKTHFDSKVIIFFMIIFILSCGLLAFKKSNEVDCDEVKFKTDETIYYENKLITFQDDSEKAFSWRWYFGDGTEISYKSKVGHVFKKQGKYKVKLLVNGTCEVEKTILVLPKPIEVVKEKLVVDFEAPIRVYQGDVVQFVDLTNNSDNWDWKFGETGKTDSKVKNPKYTYKSIGVKTVTLVVNNDSKNIMFKDIIVMSKAKGNNKPVYNKPTVRKPIDTLKTSTEKPVVVAPVKTINETQLTNLIYAISEDKLSIADFKANFCEELQPRVKLQDGKYCSLEQLHKSIKNKGIKIRKVTIYKEPDKCIETIFVSFKYKTFF